MTTYWISSSGTDTDNGLTYARAWKNIDKARTTCATGDTVNVVNDGDHETMVGFIGAFFNFAGTNHTTDPGLVITGSTSNGTAAIATIACTGNTNREWMEIGSVAKFITVQGIRFDYTALQATAAATNMRPLLLRGQPWSHRLLDCEVMLTTGIGETIAAQQMPVFPYFDGSSTPHAASELEIARCVFINATGMGGNITSQTYNAHHNVVLLDGEGYSDSMLGWNFFSDAGTLRRFYNNTIVVNRYSAEDGVPAVSSAGDDTAVLAVYNNLLYMECGPTAVNGMLGAVLDGLVGSTQTAAVTTGYDLIALGPNMTPFYSTWTLTEPGLTSYQYNDNWRNSQAHAGTNVEPNTDLVTSQTLDQVFNTTSSTYTWTPDVFDHVLPMDYRPRQGLTTGLAGGYVGAIEGAPPVANPDTYSTTAGDTKTVTAGAGVLINDTDPGGETLTASLVVDVSTGTLNLSSDGGFTYVTDPTYTGTETFEYKAKNQTGILSNQTTATINITAQPIIPPGGGGDITFEGIIDSAPFYRPVFKADTLAMIQVRRNNNYKHIDLRHYLRDEQHDESTSRTVHVAASGGRTAVTLGGVATTQGVILESDQTVSVSFMYHNGTTTVAFTAEVDGVCTFDQVGLNNIVVNNTSSTTATVNVAVFD